jgi:RNA polymerase sigma-70 factor, ECF subfamily
MAMAEKDKSLVERALTGDSRAFGDLVERYERLVHGVILETVRRPDEVEDLVQEVFCRAYEQLASLREPSRFAGWISRMAGNISVQWLRRYQVRNRTAGQDEHWLRFPERQPDEIYEDREIADYLWEALDRLAPEYRRVVVLYCIEGCTYREIGRFLGIALPTVRWRLLRARGRLVDELGGIVNQEILSRPRKKQSVREKIMAGLPLMAFFQPRQTGGWLRVCRQWGLVALVGAVNVGLLGLLYQTWWDSPGDGDWSVLKEMSDASGFRVRRAEVELPGTSVFREPRWPITGELVRLEAAGLDLPEEEQKAELHYITNPLFPVDRVVEMRREGDVWEAEVEVPQGAAAVFYYMSPAEGPRNFDQIPINRLFEEKELRRYTGSFLVHDERRWPVRDAAFRQARMAQLMGRPNREILAFLDREIARYPGNFRAHYVRWQIMEREGEGERIRAQVERELQAFKIRFADNPEAFWWIVRLQGMPKEHFYEEMRRRFPRYERLDEAAYFVAQNFLARSDRPGQMRALEDLIASFPDSRYQDEAHMDLLIALKDADPKRAIRLADDLIEGRVEVPYDPERQKDQITRSGICPLAASFLPAGLAYRLRFERFILEGDTGAALDLARRLAASDLPDPRPYEYIGRYLAEEYLRSVPLAASLVEARFLELAIQVLEAGWPWTEVEHQLSLPGWENPIDIPEYARERLTGWNREDAASFRRNYLQILDQCRLEEQDAGRRHPYLQEAAAVRAKRL